MSDRTLRRIAAALLFCFFTLTGSVASFAQGMTGGGKSPVSADATVASAEPEDDMAGVERVPPDAAILRWGGTSLTCNMAAALPSRAAAVRASKKSRNRT